MVKVGELLLLWVCVAQRVHNFGTFDLHSFFYKNVFYKNIKAELCKSLRIF